MIESDEDREDEDMFFMTARKYKVVEVYEVVLSIRIVEIPTHRVSNVTALALHDLAVKEGFEIEHVAEFCLDSTGELPDGGGRGPTVVREPTRDELETFFMKRVV